MGDNKMKILKLAAFGLALGCIGAPALANDIDDDNQYYTRYNTQTTTYYVQTYPTRPRNEVDRFSRAFNHETNMASKRFNQNVNNFSKWFNGRLKIRQRDDR
jgi:hypothetical protein